MSNTKNYAIIFYGIPGSGKSTILEAVRKNLITRGHSVVALDDIYVDLPLHIEQNIYKTPYMVYPYFDTSNKRFLDPLIRLIVNQKHTVLLSVRGYYPLGLFQEIVNADGDKIGPITVGCTVDFTDLLATDSNHFYKDILENNNRTSNPKFIRKKDDEIPGVTYSIGETLKTPDFLYNRSTVENVDLFADNLINSI